MILTSSEIDECAAASVGGVRDLKLLEQKLGVKPRHRVTVINAPPESRRRLSTADSLSPDQADVVIGFATRPVDLAWLKPAYAAARAGRLAWISYPKPGRPGTDLRRDWLIRALHQYGVEAAQDVSIDHAWSAVRLHRPKTTTHLTRPRPPTDTQLFSYVTPTMLDKSFGDGHSKTSPIY